MSTISQRTLDLRARYFNEDQHPYRLLERAIEEKLRPDDLLLEVGCGRTAPVLSKFRGRTRRLVGVDPVTFELAPELQGEIELVSGDMAHTTLESASVDLAISRALMEHVRDPGRALEEMQRVLKAGGHYIFLAPNLGDYGSILAWLTPNRFHADIVKRVEGRELEDTFPAFFRCNTRGTIERLCESSGLVLESCEYLGQYPAYLQFNAALFLLGTGYEKLISRFHALRFLRGWLLVVLRKP
ncbi:MAG: class I SAM-dependent methyltransferase [bacterium]